MPLLCEKTSLPGVLLFKPDIFADDRGSFRETFHAAKYRELGLEAVFVQDNFSRSKRDVLRGLHYQLRHPQGKLVAAMQGAIFDVAVDIRVGSPTFGRWMGQVLSDENGFQLFIPAGFAHGFCVLSDIADVLYKCTDYYVREDDCGLRWSDPGLTINWPVKSPILSAKDEQLPIIQQLTPDKLPRVSS